jgi:hypothetical protein
MKELLELAKKAEDEKWDAYRIMAEFMALQKETDAKIAEQQGAIEIAQFIRNQ